MNASAQFTRQVIYPLRWRTSLYGPELEMPISKAHLTTSGTRPYWTGRI
jgi:hypothetical protein